MRIAIPGSSRAQDESPTTLAAPEERVEISVILRPNPDAPSQLDPMLSLPAQREYAEPQDFAATEADIAALGDFAQEHGLGIESTDANRRTVVLSGRVDKLNSAFKVSLAYRDEPEGSSRCHAGEVTIPTHLENIIVGIFGLESCAVAVPHYRHSPAAEAIEAREAGYSPDQLGSWYAFPETHQDTTLDGTGQCIGILALGGTYNPADIATYFKEIYGKPPPRITTVPINGAALQPGDQPFGDHEVMLDVVVAASIAPQAHIVVYVAPDSSSRSFYDAASTAIYDQENRPSVISTSWGGMEKKDWPHPPILVSWTHNGMHCFDALLREAAFQGISFCAASGDCGSSVAVTAGPMGSIVMVDFPASSPYALGCGGTLVPSLDAPRSAEVVWNDLAALMAGAPTPMSGGSSSGGISEVFPLPDYQQSADIPGAAYGQSARGVPDVAAHAAAAPGYLVIDQGEFSTMGGTSAGAPLWAGLIARLNQAIGQRVGFINPLLYHLQLKQRREVLFPITRGCNGAYHAAPDLDWNACTGLGTPDGQKLLDALLGAQPGST
jgi:kumamolisin